MMFWWVLKASFIKLTSYIINYSYFLECMQSAFSPKISCKLRLHLLMILRPCIQAIVYSISLGLNA